MDHTPGDVPVAAGTRELREEIERARNELGDTVEALAAKADVKARAKETAERVRTSAVDGVVTAKERAGRAVRDPGNAARVKGGGAAAAGTAAATVVVWAIRRRRARSRSSWERAADASRQAWARAGTAKKAPRGRRAAVLVVLGTATGLAAYRLRQRAATPERSL